MYPQFQNAVGTLVCIWCNRKGSDQTAQIKISVYLNISHPLFLVAGHTINLK